MSKGLMIFMGIIVVVGIFTFSTLMWVWGTYNGLVKQNEAVTTQWSQVETQYQRRFDLIPNLVNATKGFLKQEQKVFGDIAEARTHYANAKSGTNEKVVATNQMESALARLMVVMENYPVLQSVQTVKDLMTELAGTENRINVARERYNERVQEYNVAVKTFPGNLVAGFGGFEPRDFFEAKDGADTAPTVNLE